MSILQILQNLDEQLTLFINGSSSLYLDRFAILATSTWVWLPIAIVLLLVLLKNESRRNVITILIFILLCILWADQVASSICKPYFERLRPSQDVNICHCIDIVEGYRGGKYGFFSSHAANTFAVATFVALLIRNYGLSMLLYSWALLNCWTRLYLGVHYVGDIVVGMMWGISVGYLMYFVWRRWVCDNSSWNSTARPGITTVSGYQVDSVLRLNLSIVLTYIVIIFLSFLPLF